MTARILRDARRRAGLSQRALATRAGTSRTALSAYEHGRKSPTVETAERILGAAGFELTLRSLLRFEQVRDERGREFSVPSSLMRLPASEATATVELPIHLNWSDRGREYDLRDRRQRARVYEAVLREGTPSDITRYIDGALLVDLWPDLVLPPAIREAWSPLVEDPGVGTRS